MYLPAEALEVTHNKTTHGPDNAEEGSLYWSCLVRSSSVGSQYKIPQWVLCSSRCAWLSSLNLGPSFWSMHVHPVWNNLSFSYKVYLSHLWLSLTRKTWDTWKDLALEKKSQQAKGAPRAKRVVSHSPNSSPLSAVHLNNDLHHLLQLLLVCCILPLLTILILQDCRSLHHWTEIGTFFFEHVLDRRQRAFKHTNWYSGKDSWYSWVSWAAVVSDLLCLVLYWDLLSVFVFDEFCVSVCKVWWSKGGWIHHELCCKDVALSYWR